MLCEKPLAVTVRACEEMIETANRHGVLLMTGYRLHFDAATLKAIEVVRSGKIGEPRFFASTFSMQVTDPDNVRLLSVKRGGGPLLDLGVYCVNAARGLFESEPIEVLGMDATAGDERFSRSPEMTFAVLRFPGERVATFGCSFGAAETSAYHVVGTKGDLRVEPAFEYAEPLEHRLTVNGRVSRRRFAKRDQFAPELIAFSNAVLGREAPSTLGIEGLLDVRVIEAIQQSSEKGKVVSLTPFQKDRYAEPEQEIRRPPVRKPEPVLAESPHN